MHPILEGMLPVTEFLNILNHCICHKYPTEEGMLPAIRLYSTLKVMRLDRHAMLEGIEPDKQFELKYNAVADDKLPIEAGNDPTNVFPYKNMDKTSVNAPILLGIVPNRPLLLTSTPVTLPLVPSLHEMPCQSHTADTDTPSVHFHPLTVVREQRFVEPHRSHSADSGIWGWYTVVVSAAIADTSLGMPPVR
jgi:hypothetical protein